jgi:hypothetical protein
MSTQANPTHSTLDAAEHERDLEAQRKQRKESAELKSSTTHGGDQIGQIPIEDEYPFDEAQDQIEKRITKKAPSVAEEVNSDCPCNK